MSLPTRCLQLRVYVGENHNLGPLPLYEAIILQARRDKMAGATVFRGQTAFGHSNLLAGARDSKLSDTGSILIEIIDSPEKVQEFLPYVMQTVGRKGLVTIDEVTVVHYGGDT